MASPTIEYLFLEGALSWLPEGKVCVFSPILFLETASALSPAKEQQAREEDSTQNAHLINPAL